MKAVIPLAGKGTRLRPHTLITPKPLVRVAGKPVLDYILDDLIEAGVSEVVFIVGHLQDAIRAHVARAYPQIAARYAVQEVQDGTAGAVALAEPWIDGELLIVFADTLFEADLGLAAKLPPDKAGAIWAREVEDYQRYGVIVTDADGNMARIVEKPSEPVSKLANIGLYHIRDHRLLFEGIERVRAAGPGPSGEYYLTDAFQHMVDSGAKIVAAPVASWLDAGNVGALLEANRHKLESGRAGLDPGAAVAESTISPLARVEAGAQVTRSLVGCNVTVEAGARIRDSELRDTIVGAGARVEGCRLRNSIVGRGASARRHHGTLNIADHSQVLAAPDP